MKWRWIFLWPVLTFFSSASSVWRGDFADSDLAPSTLMMHVAANALEGIGWLVVFLTARRYSPFAGRLGLFLAGMWLWDMTTTLALRLPLPPMQFIWGPATVAILIGLSIALVDHRPGSSVR